MIKCMINTKNLMNRRDDAFSPDVNVTLTSASYKNIFQIKSIIVEGCL